MKILISIKETGMQMASPFLIAQVEGPIELL
jgi:hypothetical protein